MKIAAFRVKNFKCFQDTGLVTLAPGMNIVTGQNNAGKTALLQALSRYFCCAPHLSLASMPERGSASNRVSEIEIALTVSGNELLEMANTLGNVGFALPINPSVEYLRERGVRLQSLNDIGGFPALWQAIVAAPEIEFRMTTRAFGNDISTAAARNPSHGLFEVHPPGITCPSLTRRIQDDGSESFGIVSGAAIDLGISLWPQMQSRIYRFTAERFGLSDCVCGNNKVLESNARNLAEVLLNLRANPGRFEKYLELINEILPQVKWIDLEPIDGNMVRVKVWSIDKSTMREDLAMPLHECGTGIGQVLSMVYVAFVSDRPQVLLIDEPQSFLHPGAARKLIEVLKRFPKHQYVISTHSASVIAASGSPDILILDAESGVSTIKHERTDDIEAMQQFLEAMGARLSDVFGMDRVLWVEGATEEKAFPILLEKMDERTAGTVVVSIRNTGDLDGKDRKKAFEIYNSLTGKATMLPRKVAFVLDREARTDDVIREFDKLSGGKAHFLPRRTFENYLLHTAAICEVINAIEGFSDAGEIDELQIAACLEECLFDARCWTPHPLPKHPSLEVPELHGAKVLEKLFARMSGNRVSYDKIKHSVAIFKWIVKNDQKSLSELEELLRKILQQN